MTFVTFDNFPLPEKYNHRTDAFKDGYRAFFDNAPNRNRPDTLRAKEFDAGWNAAFFVVQRHWARSASQEQAA